LAIGLVRVGGMLFEAEQYSEAKAILIRGLDVLRPTVEIPEDELLQRDLCITAARLGGYLSAFGLRAEAEESWQRALTLARHRLGTDPENEEVLALAAETAQRLGELVAASGRFADAKRHLEEALSGWHRLAVAEPGDRAVAQNQSSCLNVL